MLTNDQDHVVDVVASHITDTCSSWSDAQLTTISTGGYVDCESPVQLDGVKIIRRVEDGRLSLIFTDAECLDRITKAIGGDAQQAADLEAFLCNRVGLYIFDSRHKDNLAPTNMHFGFADPTNLIDMPGFFMTLSSPVPGIDGWGLNDKYIVFKRAIAIATILIQEIKILEPYNADK